MKNGNTLFRLPSLLGAAALTLTIAASTPSYAYDDGACDPSCACPDNQYDSSCAYDAPYAVSPYGYYDYGSDWTYGSRLHEDNHRSYGYDHSGSNNHGSGGFSHAGGFGGHGGGFGGHGGGGHGGR